MSLPFSGIPIEAVLSVQSGEHFAFDISLGLDAFTYTVGSENPVGFTLSALCFYRHPFSVFALKLGVGLSYANASVNATSGSYKEDYGFLNLIADVGVEFAVSEKTSLSVDAFFGGSAYSYISSNGESMSSAFGGELSYKGQITGYDFGTVTGGFKLAAKYRFGNK